MKMEFISQSIVKVELVARRHDVSFGGFQSTEYALRALLTVPTPFIEKGLEIAGI